MQVQVWRGLGDRADQWDRLVLAAPVPSPFLLSWWLTATAHPALEVVVVVEGEVLLGGLAVQGERRLGLPWVTVAGGGALQPDHLDVVSLPSRAAEVADAVVRHWAGGGSRVVDLQGLDPDAAVLAALRGDGDVDVIEVAPCCALPEGFDPYLAARSGSLRSLVSRNGRRLERDGVSFRLVAADDAARALADLRGLHLVRWGEGSSFLPGWERFAAAVHAGIGVGGVVIGELVSGEGEVIASECVLRAGVRACSFQAGRVDDHRWRGSGSVLQARLMQALAAEGCTEYDLLRGDEPYKALWATGSRTVCRVQRGFGARGRTTVAAAQATRRWR